MSSSYVLHDNSLFWCRVVLPAFNAVWRHLGAENHLKKINFNSEFLKRLQSSKTGCLWVDKINTNNHRRILKIPKVKTLSVWLLWAVIIVDCAMNWLTSNDRVGLIMVEDLISFFSSCWMLVVTDRQAVGHILHFFYPEISVNVYDWGYAWMCVCVLPLTKKLWCLGKTLHYSKLPSVF